MKSRPIPVAPGFIRVRVTHVASGEFLGTVVVGQLPYDKVKHLGGFKAMRLLNPDQLERLNINSEVGIKVVAV